MNNDIFLDSDTEICIPYSSRFTKKWTCIFTTSAATSTASRKKYRRKN